MGRRGSSGTGSPLSRVPTLLNCALFMDPYWRKCFQSACYLESGHAVWHNESNAICFASVQMHACLLAATRPAFVNSRVFVMSWHVVVADRTSHVGVQAGHRKLSLTSRLDAELRRKTCKGNLESARSLSRDGRAITRAFLRSRDGSKRHLLYSVPPVRPARCRARCTHRDTTDARSPRGLHHVPEGCSWSVPLRRPACSLDGTIDAIAEQTLADASPGSLPTYFSAQFLFSPRWSVRHTFFLSAALVAPRRPHERKHLQAAWGSRKLDRERDIDRMHGPRHPRSVCLG